MANQYQPNPRPSIGQRWLDFLFGNPVRTLIIAMVTLMVVAPHVMSALATRAFGNVWLVIGPLLQPALMLVIIVWGFRFMLKPLRPAKKKKKGGH